MERLSSRTVSTSPLPLGHRALIDNLFFLDYTNSTFHPLAFSPVESPNEGDFLSPQARRYHGQHHTDRYQRWPHIRKSNATIFSHQYTNRPSPTVHRPRGPVRSLPHPTHPPSPPTLHLLDRRPPRQHRSHRLHVPIPEDRPHRTRYRCRRFRVVVQRDVLHRVRPDLLLVPG